MQIPNGANFTYNPNTREKPKYIRDLFEKHVLQNVKLAPIDFYKVQFGNKSLKGDMVSMEVPIYALSKNKDVDIWNWVSSNGKKTIKVIPSAEYGRATVFDKDVVIFAISCLVERYNNGIKPTKVIRFSAYSYFKTTGSGTNSREYKRLEASLKRLATTSIETNISAGKKHLNQVLFIWLNIAV